MITHTLLNKQAKNQHDTKLKKENYDNVYMYIII